MEMEERQMDPEVREGLARSWKGLMAVGVLAIVVGCVAILVPAVASVGTAIFIGWILVIAGAFLVAGAFTAHSVGTVVLRLIWAALTVSSALWLIVEPHNGTLTLTLVLGIYFLFMGLTRIAVAFSGRGQPNAGLVGLSGVAGLLIGILVLAKFPSSADWAIGLLVGIDLIFAGWTLTVVALVGKDLCARARADRATATRAPHYDPRVSSPLVLVMAAGEGTRMRSSLPKMLHPVCGRPMVAWPILAAREAGAGRVAAIVSPGRDISAGLPEGVETVVQPEPDGTGGAVRAALPLIEDGETVLVLSGDVPLISAETIAGLLAAHAASAAAATMLTIELDDPGRLRPRRPRPLAARSSAWSRPKPPATPTPRSWRSARSTPAPTPSTRRRWPPPSPASPTTTPRASTTCPTSSRPCARRATRSPPTSPTTSR